MTLLTIEILAAIFGVLGTVLLALRGPRAGWGFLLYLASNACWLTSSWIQSQWPLFAQQLAFLVSSCLGIWIWIVRPALQRVDRLFAIGDES